MNTNGVNFLDFEASALELVDEPAKRSRSISAGEDVFVHEQTPDKILVLPRLAQTGNLKEEDTVVVQHIVDLLQEFGKVTDTNVFSHLKTSDFIIAALDNRNVSVVHAEDLALLFGNTDFAKSAVAPGGLVATKRNTSGLCTIVGAGEAGKSTPAAANIQEGLALFETDLLAHNGQLVVLELLEALLLVDIRNDTRGVNHARTQEPSVEIITAVVVVTDLLLVCSSQELAMGDASLA